MLGSSRGGRQEGQPGYDESIYNVKEDQPFVFFFFFSSRRRHTIFSRDWSSDVCSSDLPAHNTRKKLVVLTNPSPRPPCAAGSDKYAGIQVNSPQYPNMPQAFMAVASAPLRKTSLRSRSRKELRVCDFSRSFHSAGSGTRRWIQDASNAGSTPAKNTARQPNRGSTMATTSAAMASPIAYADCISPSALPRCSARHVSAISAAPVVHSPPIPKPRTKRNTASCRNVPENPHAALDSE